MMRPIRRLRLIGFSTAVERTTCGVSHHVIAFVILCEAEEVEPSGPRLMPPSKQLGGSEALTCLYVNLLPTEECSGYAPQKFVGYDIKPEKQIVHETRLHNNKHGFPHGPPCASLLNQLLELLVMVEHE